MRRQTRASSARRDRTTPASPNDLLTPWSASARACVPPRGCLRRNASNRSTRSRRFFLSESRTRDMSRRSAGELASDLSTVPATSMSRTAPALRRSRLSFVRNFSNLGRSAEDSSHAAASAARHARRSSWTIAREHRPVFSMWRHSFAIKRTRLARRARALSESAAAMEGFDATTHRIAAESWAAFVPREPRSGCRVVDHADGNAPMREFSDCGRIEGNSEHLGAAHHADFGLNRDPGGAAIADEAGVSRTPVGERSECRRRSARPLAQGYGTEPCWWYLS